MYSQVNEMNGLFKSVKKAVKKVVKAPVKIIKAPIKIAKKTVAFHKKLIKPMAKIALAPIVAPLAIQAKVMQTLMPMAPAVADEPIYQPEYIPPAPVYQPLQYYPTQYQPPQYQPPQYYPTQYQPPQYQPPQYQPPQYQPPQYQPPQYQPEYIDYSQDAGQEYADDASYDDGQYSDPYNFYNESDYSMTDNYDNYAMNGLFSGLKDKLQGVVQKAGVAVATAYGGPAAGAAVKGLLDARANKKIQGALINQAGQNAAAIGLPREAGENEARRLIGLSTTAKIGIGAGVLVGGGLLVYFASRPRRGR